MKVVVTGASDDLVEIDGDLVEEFNGDDVTVIFGDGTHLSVKYGDDGCWHIERTVEGTAKYTKVFIATNSNSNDYSDKVELEGDLKSVEKNLSYGEICDALADAKWGGNVDGEALREIYALAKKAGAI